MAEEICLPESPTCGERTWILAAPLHILAYHPSAKKLLRPVVCLEDAATLLYRLNTGCYVAQKWHFYDFRAYF